MDLGRMLEATASRFGERTAFLYEDDAISYERLNRSVSAFANYLKTLGLGRGDHIAVMLANCPEFVVSYFAIQKLGGVAVTLNVLSTPYELRHLLGNSDSRAFITSASAAKRYEEIKPEIPLCRHLILADGESSPFPKALAEGPFTFAIPDIGPDDPAVMIYTAGLTGKPRGAVLTHNNLYTQSNLLRSICQADESARGLAIIPFFHSFGAVANMLAVIRVGASAVLMDHFTLDSIFGAIERQKVTYIAAVPRLFLGMVFHDRKANFDVSSLRFCVTGGAAMPPDFIPVFEKEFHVKILEGYGLTEGSPVSSFNRLDIPPKTGSIGVAIPGVEIRIVDEQDREVTRGTVGELVIRGENVMKGYYKDEEATAQVMRNGWLHSSDLGFMDEEGYIFLTGRKKRMVITSGFNVYPREVEIVLEMHPAVRKARVEGKADLLRGEIVKAFVVKKAGAAVEDRELSRYCRTYLSSYKVPREIEFVDRIEGES
ncbi:MAG: Long-chain-fatty-acid--CoA ligase [Syntrophaceae bacterium PtaU1.Bin231]|nr:MAG: Long-chain-fatty-acid--CoA ligase [Syntrophaceae bacterium PtaU1.Bin231]